MTVPEHVMVPGLSRDGDPFLVPWDGDRYGSSFRVDVELPNRPVAVAALRKSLEEACAAARNCATMGRTRIYVWDDEEGTWMMYTEAAETSETLYSAEDETAPDRLDDLLRRYGTDAEEGL